MPETQVECWVSTELGSGNEPILKHFETTIFLQTSRVLLNSNGGEAATKFHTRMIRNPKVILHQLQKPEALIYLSYSYRGELISTHMLLLGEHSASLEQCAHPCYHSSDQQMLK